VLRLEQECTTEGQSTNRRSGAGNKVCRRRHNDDVHGLKWPIAGRMQRGLEINFLGYYICRNPSPDLFRLGS
jgi:hypothetical protein